MEKILYVEDDKINALIISKIVGKHFDIEIAKDGEECVEKAKHNNYDLVLVDIHLGNEKMDGVEVLECLRKYEGYATKPIFAITAYAMPEDRKKYLNLGFNSYYSKPINHQKLIEEIKQFLTK